METILHFLFYQNLCIKFYIEVFDALEMSMLQCDKYESTCLLQHAAIELELWSLIKKLTFSRVHFWLIYQKLGVTGMWTYFSVFNYIPLTSGSVWIQ